jgi:hypothetical protein
VIFFFCYAVVNTMFPLMAGARGEERNNNKLLATSLLTVFAIGST